MNSKDLENVDEVINFINTTIPDEVVKFRLHLDKETDRGCALMAAAFLDELLKKLLEKYMVNEPNSFKELFTGSGGLSSFSSKINLSYLLGLISEKSKRDLHIIRKIRNEFAHSMEIIDFEHPPIASRCRELHHNVFRDELSPRKSFVRIAFGVAGLLNGAMLMVEKRSVHENIDFDSDEWLKGIVSSEKLLKEIALYQINNNEQK
ncbi:MltR family transcriptional regulator [Paenibacillus sp. FSL E2-8871]|uniref:MltR family transcriptional regulator n=1 Tax=Paenibacillus sp. FSL E2-8871 TaxID=2975326 RepID=UPI0030F76718